MKEFDRLFNHRHERPGDVFMDLLEREKLIVAPGTYSAMGAQIARQIYLESKDKISLALLTPSTLPAGPSAPCFGLYPIWGFTI